MCVDGRSARRREVLSGGFEAVGGRRGLEEEVGAVVRRIGDFEAAVAADYELHRLSRTSNELLLQLPERSVGGRRRAGRWLLRRSEQFHGLTRALHSLLHW